MPPWAVSIRLVPRIPEPNMKSALHPKAWALIAAAVALSPQTRALVIGDYTGGVYSYEVQNTTTDKTIIGWSLSTAILPDWAQDDVAAGGDVSVPSDWFAVAGTAAGDQDFLSTGGDILAGNLLRGFSFPSGYTPGKVTYIEFYDDLTSAVGSTLGPVGKSLPDGGGTLMLGAMGLVAVLQARRIARRA